MTRRRAEPVTAAGRHGPAADAQLTRAFVAVAIGLRLALWALRPIGQEPNVHAMLPEFRALAGIPTLVI
jgi:hypothetical protein